jgi:hypothetical protein
MALRRTPGRDSRLRQLDKVVNGVQQEILAPLMEPECEERPHP